MTFTEGSDVVVNATATVAVGDPAAAARDTVRTLVILRVVRSIRNIRDDRRELLCHLCILRGCWRLPIHQAEVVTSQLVDTILDRRVLVTQLMRCSWKHGHDWKRRTLALDIVDDDHRC